MKGTMKRGKTPGEDRENRDRLHESIKNRAENVMIVDLLRNDIGAVARTGSVAVTSLFDVERYGTLFQMTSTVKGILPPETSYSDIFRRLFPCGSVTGAPKIRSMEIIHELEQAPRGVYTGAVGYIAPDGEAVFNVAIRTPVIRGGEGVMGIGSGIVWDSDPADEYGECRLKADFLVSPPVDFELLETLLFKNGRFRLLRGHIERMGESAEYFGFRFDARQLEDFLDGFARDISGNGPYRVRVLCNWHGRLRAEHAELGTVVRKDRGGRIAFAATAVDSADTMLYHKTTRREVYDRLYRAARERGLADVIFQNERGEVTEGAISNVFIRTKGRLCTPPVRCGLLNGLMRRYIMAKLEHAREEVITPDDVRCAEAVYICNSVRGVTRVAPTDEIVSEK